jgi:hypothetical protein
MNCQNHAETPATAYFRSCGKPVCEECRRDAYGTVFCAEHTPAPAMTPPPPPAPGPGAQPAPPPPLGYVYADVSPGLAFFLGWIPGVGAIYNGQYAKGLVHAVIFGLMCSILDSNTRGLSPVFGVLLAAFMFYMAFEAYHTARKRRMGEPVDEYSSLLNLSGRNQFPVAGVALMALGVVLLLHTLDLLDFSRILPFWPVLLIAAGAYLLYSRFAGQDGEAKEIGHERR